MRFQWRALASLLWFCRNGGADDVKNKTLTKVYLNQNLTDEWNVAASIFYAWNFQENLAAVCDMQESMPTNGHADPYRDVPPVFMLSYPHRSDDVHPLDYINVTVTSKFQEPIAAKLVPFFTRNETLRVVNISAQCADTLQGFAPNGTMLFNVTAQYVERLARDKKSKGKFPFWWIILGVALVVVFLFFILTKRSGAMPSFGIDL